MKVDYKTKLLEKLQKKDAVIGLIGIGYVGSALAHISSSKGFSTIGFDIDQEKIDSHNNLHKKNLQATESFSLLRDCDVVCICVPTPIHEDKTPDLRFVESAVDTLVNHLRKGQLVVLESSVAIGTTRDVVLPRLLKSGFSVDRDFFLGFSPERIDPGNASYTVDQIPKVVAGIGEESGKLIEAFYKCIINQVIPVSSVEAAEASKLLENTFRFVNISFINEFAEYMKARNVDVWEVINAASTKPFGFMPHYPGPGIGGHCIPVDPYYLLEDAKKYGVDLSLVAQSGKVNDQISTKVANRVVEILKSESQRNGKSEVLLLGVSYKANVADLRESPALSIWAKLQEIGISVSYHDPFVSRVNGSQSQKLSPAIIRKHDLIVITTDHSGIDYVKLAKYNKPILDTRNVLKRFASDHIYHV